MEATNVYTGNNQVKGFAFPRCGQDYISEPKENGQHVWIKKEQLTCSDVKQEYWKHGIFPSVRKIFKCVPQYSSPSGNIYEVYNHLYIVSYGAAIF